MNTLYLFICLIHLNVIFCEINEINTKEEKFSKKEHFSGYEDGLNKFFEIFKKRQGNFNGLLDKNPDIYRTSAEIIASRGFRSEEHTVVTDDGYILGIFRIINPYISANSRLKPVLIWHQILTNSNLWLISTPGFLDIKGHYSEGNGTVKNNCRDRLTSNVAFTLAACGYDVWLGNTRGNRYSPRHMTYPRFSKAFANYTFTELGVYDAKNTVEYIINNTNSHCVGYIGSSLGSTIIYTLISMIPSFEKYVKPIITMPTVVFEGNTTSLLRLVGPFIPLLNDAVFSLGLPLALGQAIAELCGNVLIQPLCVIFAQIVLSNYPSHLTAPETLGVVFSVVAGNYISIRAVLQYGQFLLNGRFNQFDYMKAHRNVEHYGTPTAPDYPLGSITSRNQVMLRGPNDAACRKADLDHLISSMTVPPLDVYVVKNLQYYHLDFPLSKFNNILINQRILAHLSTQQWKMPDEDEDEHDESEKIPE